MDRPTVTGLIEALKDPKQEEMMYDQMRGIRNRMNGELAVPEGTQRSAIAHYALKAITKISKHLLDRADLDEADAGHGPGHWQRDCLHSLVIMSDLAIPLSAILPGMVGGALHDIGTLFVDRYDDKKRAVRHAEAGALLVRAAAIETESLTPMEADVVAYAIAAHTHYLKPSDVECADGKTRKVEPYRDMRGDEPMLEVWLPRWTDRLDCSGPCMVGRHYLTLHRDHEDFNGNGFYKVSFAEHMQPLFRTPDEIKAAGGSQKMTEHLRMFAASQSHDSPYGKHDRGDMVTWRNEYRASLEYVLGRVANPLSVDVEKISKAWHMFLAMNIEPSKKGQEAAAQLEKAFMKLDAECQRAWACGFRTTMTEYVAWFDRMQHFVNDLPPEISSALTEGLLGGKNIQPDMEWLSRLSG